MAIVGVAHLNLAAAAEIGVALDRVVVVDPTPGQWASAVAALVGAVDVVLTGPAPRAKAADHRRLQARARERGSVLVQVGSGGPTEGIDLTLTVTSSSWEGLGRGHGVLRSRLVTIEAAGRREAARPRRVDVLLPGPSGAVEVPDVAAVTHGGWAGADVDDLIAAVPDDEQGWIECVG